MNPRYNPSWHDVFEGDEFLGHIGELDVIFNTKDHSVPHFYVVGPRSRVRPHGHNYDAYKAIGNTLVLDGVGDLNITPYELGRLYEMAMEKGLIQ